MLRMLASRGSQHRVLCRKRGFDAVIGRGSAVLLLSMENVRWTYSYMRSKQGSMVSHRFRVQFTRNLMLRVTMCTSCSKAGFTVAMLP